MPPEFVCQMLPLPRFYGKKKRGQWVKIRKIGKYVYIYIYTFQIFELFVAWGDKKNFPHFNFVSCPEYAPDYVLISKIFVKMSFPLIPLYAIYI